MTTASTRSAVPTVSVIMPVYNGQAYLERAIDSVLAQSHRELELCVCDDASTDGSRAILERIAAADPRVRLLLHAKNQGLFPTLNELLQQARAELVHVFLQDDEMYPACIEAELRFHRAHPEVPLAYCAYDSIDAHGTRSAARANDETPELLTPAQASELMFYYGALSGNLSTVSCKRSAVQALGGFRNDLKMSGDFELFVRAAAEHPIGRIREPLLAVRRHAGQLSRRRDAQPQFMRENHVLRRELLGRLPEDARADALDYARRHVHIRYLHHAVRRALAGDLGSARETLSVLRDIDSPAKVALHWLLSANGRFRKPQPKLRSFPQL